MPAEAKSLAERVVDIERKVAGLRQPRDGRDGLDGRDADPAIPGDRGADGKDGRDGKDVDQKALIESLIPECERMLNALPKPKDGEPGRDATPDQVDAAVLRFFEISPPVAAKDGARGPRGLRGPDGEQGKAGERGARGPRGPIGPMPRHEWDGSKLRFEEEPGVWGEWHDLRGPAGEGGGGRLPTAPAITQVNSYFPSGW